MKSLRINTLLVALFFVPSVNAASQKLEPAFESLVDNYLAEFRGIGAGPSVVNDGSANYYKNRLQTAQSLLVELQSINRQALTFQQDIDFRFLQGILKAKVMDGERIRYWQKDPTLYLRIEPIVSPRGGLLYLEDRPVAERAASILTNMKTIPARLENAKINLQVFIPLWLEPAKGLLAGAVETFEIDVVRFADRVPGQRAELLAENEKVLAALRDFGDFLNAEWPTRPKGEWRVGREVFDTRLRDFYHIADHDAESLYQWGRNQYQEQLAVVEWVLTPDFGFYPPDKQDEYRVEMERLKLWRYARVIYDAGMHLGHVTVDEAVDLMTSDVMFAEPYSFLQVQGATHGYGRTGVATWGYHEFMALRDEYFARMYLMGLTGTLKDFHDRVLKIGTLPYALLREELLHDIQ